MTPLPESTAGPKTTIVITSISAPNQALRDYALGCARHGAKLLVMGDQESPSDFSLDECDYYDVRRQLETGFRAAAVAPLGHYARKNIGYLLAMGAGAPYIVETDDDNIPLPGFWSSRRKRHTVRCSVNRGWVNVYRYFSSGAIWPRGFPLSELRTPVIPFDELPLREIECPIQQALADGDPDVDSIHRLVFPGRTHFAANRSVAPPRCTPVEPEAPP